MKFGIQKRAEEFVVAWVLSENYKTLRAVLRHRWEKAPKLKSLRDRARRYRQAGVRLKVMAY